MDYEKAHKIFFEGEGSEEHLIAAGVRYWEYDTDIYMALHCPVWYIKTSKDPTGLELLEMVK